MTLLRMVAHIAIISTVVAFVSWEYYNAAWGGNASSALDGVCMTRLHMLADSIKQFSAENGRLPKQISEVGDRGLSERFAAKYSGIGKRLSELGISYDMCPRSPHPPYLLLPDGTIVCTNHSEHQPGWNLRFDRAAHSFGLDGEARYWSARETRRLLAATGPVRTEEEASEAMAVPDAPAQVPMHREDSP